MTNCGNIDHVTRNWQFRQVLNLELRRVVVAPNPVNESLLVNSFFPWLIKLQFIVPLTCTAKDFLGSALQVLIHPRREPITHADICLPYLLTRAASGKIFSVLPYCNTYREFGEEYGSTLDFTPTYFKYDDRIKFQYGIRYERFFCTLEILNFEQYMCHVNMLSIVLNIIVCNMLLYILTMATNYIHSMPTQ